MAEINDEYWMRHALAEAETAARLGEVPIGAVLVKDSQAIASFHNLKETNQDPTGHAEIRVIREAAQKSNAWRLSGTVLYVTLEPCLMCAGAIIQARIDRVVFGAKDPKAGAVVSLYQVLVDQRLNHRPQVTGGVLEAECADILSSFFRNKRNSK